MCVSKGFIILRSRPHPHFKKRYYGPVNDNDNM